MSAVIFPFRPSYPIVEDIAWVTNILESHSGKEQRIKIRKTPRQVYEYNIHLDNHQFASFLKSMILGNSWGTYMVPIWSDAVLGDSVDTSFGDYVDGGKIAVWENEGNVSVSDYDGGGIGGSSSSFIMPAKEAYCLQSMEYSANMDKTRVFKVIWDVVNEIVPPTQNLPTQYKSHDVLTEPFDIPDNKADYSISHKHSIIDYQTGKLSIIPKNDWARQSMQNVHFKIKGKAKITSMRRWLYKLSGRLVPFWLPNHQVDMEAVSSSGSSLTIKNIGYSGYLEDHPLFKHICAYTYSGGVLLREIMGCSGGGGTEETLTLSSSIGSIANIRYICFLGLYRSNSDRIEILTEDYDFASVAFPVIGVEA